MVREGKATWVSSTALEIEISRNPDKDRRLDVAALLALANEVGVPRSRSAERARFLQKLGSAHLTLSIRLAPSKAKPTCS
jgi:hypothetical protein